MEEFKIQSGKHRLAATLRDNEGPVVIVCHGFQSTKESDMARTLAEKLHENGMATVSFDQRGHGQSQGHFQEFTNSGALEDLQAVIAHVKERFPGRSIGLAGNSTGATIALWAASQDPSIKALVLHAPMSEFQEVIRNKAKTIGLTEEQLSGAWEKIGSIPYPDSHGEPSILNYTYYEDGANHNAYASAGKIRVPVLIVHSRQDQTVPFHQSEKLLEIVRQNAPAQLRAFSSGGHEFSGTNLKRYVASASVFLQKHLAR